MNEIEKLYKNAGVSKYGKRQCTDSTFLECQNYCFCGIDNKCDKFTIEYPPFTAEKQLNITKLIGLKYGLKFITNEGMDYMLSTDLYNNQIFDKQGYGYGFDEAIANLANNLWQDLTEEEKQQVKGILE